MRTTFFFFLMFVSMAASATVTVTPLSTDYAEQKVIFKVEWTNSPTAPYNNRVWIWIDFCPVNGVTPGGFAPATITGATITSGSGSISGLTGRGFFITGSTTNSGTTITATLNPVPAGKFNWCVYGSDYPPNAVINGSSYTLKGTPPFIVNGTNLGAGVTSYSGGCITSITDATGCPGLFPLPTTTSLSATPTAICNGSSAVLTASASGAASYSFDNGSSWQTTATKTVYPTTTTSYTLKVRSSAGCTSSDSKTASVTVTNGSSRDVAPNSCGCASGLTAVGGYCRNLSADAASAITCASSTGGKLEVKNTIEGTVTYANRNICPSGWHVPTYAELRCMYTARNTINLDLSHRYWSSSTTGYDNGCSAGSNQSSCRYYLCVEAGYCASTYFYPGDMVYCCGSGCAAYNSSDYVRCVR